jgi:hypothetical protein
VDVAVMAAPGGGGGAGGGSGGSWRDAKGERYVACVHKHHIGSVWPRCARLSAVSPVFAPECVAGRRDACVKRARLSHRHRLIRAALRCRCAAGTPPLARCGRPCPSRSTTARSSSSLSEIASCLRRCNRGRRRGPNAHTHDVPDSALGVGGVHPRGTETCRRRCSRVVRVCVAAGSCWGTRGTRSPSQM